MTPVRPPHSIHRMPNHNCVPSREGYTLIELFAALAAATLLIAGMAGAVTVSMRLLDDPPDVANATDRDIARLVGEDLRYATSIDDSPAYGFTLARHDSVAEELRRIIYESDTEGLTRQAENRSAVVLDPDTPTETTTVVRGESSAELADPPVRVRSVSSNGSSSQVQSLSLAVPPGVQAGDRLLIFVATEYAGGVTVGPNLWNPVADEYQSGLYLLVAEKRYGALTSDTVTVTTLFPAPIAVSILALQHAASASPVIRGATASGSSSFSNASPPAMISGSIEPTQLNIQAFAATGQPFRPKTLGIAAFVDAAQTIGNPSGDSEDDDEDEEDEDSDIVSLSIAVHSGPLPQLSRRPRALFERPATWTQAAIEVEDD